MNNRIRLIAACSVVGTLSSVATYLFAVRGSYERPGMHIELSDKSSASSDRDNSITSGSAKAQGHPQSRDAIEKILASGQGGAPWERRIALMELLAGAKAQDVEELENLLAADGHNPIFLDDNEVQLVNRRIGELLGADTVKGFIPEAAQSQAMKDRLVGFAAMFPSEALLWLSSLQKGGHGGRSAILAWDIMQGLYDADFNRANQAYSELSPFQRSAANEVVVNRNFSELGFTEAVSQVNSILNANEEGEGIDESMNEMLALKLVSRMAELDHKECRDWLEANLSKNYIIDTMFSDYAKAAYGEVSGEGLLDWGKGVAGTSIEATTGLIGIAKVLAERDINILGEWLIRNADMKDADRIASVIAAAARPIDEEASIAWEAFAEERNEAEVRDAMRRLTEIDRGRRPR